MQNAYEVLCVVSYRSEFVSWSILSLWSEWNLIDIYWQFSNVIKYNWYSQRMIKVFLWDDIITLIINDQLVMKEIDTKGWMKGMPKQKKWDKNLKKHCEWETEKGTERRVWDE